MHVVGVYPAIMQTGKSIDLLTIQVTDMAHLSASSKVLAQKRSAGG
jgi:hypothetical protein